MKIDSMIGVGLSHHLRNVQFWRSVSSLSGTCGRLERIYSEWNCRAGIASSWRFSIEEILSWHDTHVGSFDTNASLFVHRYMRHRRKCNGPGDHSPESASRLPNLDIIEDQWYPQHVGSDRDIQ